MDTKEIEVLKEELGETRARLAELVGACKLVRNILKSQDEDRDVALDAIVVLRLAIEAAEFGDA